jgi:uncharacterized membrane protein
VPAFALLLFLVLLVLSPLLFGSLMLASLEKLHLSPSIALTLVIAMFVGGLVNIPIATIRRRSDVRSDPLAVYGLGSLWPQLGRSTRPTIVAVNFGGCIVPVGISVYEIAYLAQFDPHALALGIVGCLVNIAVCYSVAKPVERIGIACPR